MKFFSVLLLALVLFSANILCAQTDLKHYPIGTKEHPVTASEYCCFLNSNDMSLRDGLGHRYGRWSWPEAFYDHHLMDASNGPIIRSGKSGSCNYHYSVRTGCDDQIIDFLEGEYASQLFAKWRQLPLISDLCRYINDQIFLGPASNTQDECFSEDQQLAVNEIQEMYQSYGNNQKAREQWIKLKFATGNVLKAPLKKHTFFEMDRWPNNYKVINGPKYQGELITVSFSAALQRPVAFVKSGLNQYYRATFFYPERPSDQGFGNIDMSAMSGKVCLIGNRDNPVTAEEYCCFLKQNQNNPINEGANFYDHHLMDSSGGVIICSEKKDWSTTTYNYSVREGYEDQIIEYLESRYVQDYFKKWRSQLSVGELCRIIDDLIIIESYLNAPQNISLEVEKQAEEDIQKTSDQYQDNLEIQVELEALDQTVRKMILTGQEKQEFFGNLPYIPADNQKLNGPQVATCFGFQKGKKLITLSVQGSSQEFSAHITDGVSKYYRAWHGLYF